MDPLSVLRDFTMSKRLNEVTDDGDRIQFGDSYSFPKEMLTAYKSQRGRGALYALNAIVFWLKNAKMTANQMMRAAQELGIKPVSVVDRKDLEAYLTGAIDKSDYIQAELPQQPEEPPAKRARTDAKAAPGEAAVDEAGEEAALADLLSREKSLRDRNTQMLVPGKDFGSVLKLLADQAIKNSKAQQQTPHHSSSHRKPPSSEKKREVLPVLPSRRFERPSGEPLAELGVDEYKGATIDAYGARKTTSAAAPQMPTPPLPSSSSGGQPALPPQPAPSSSRPSEPPSSSQSRKRPAPDSKHHEHSHSRPSHHDKHRSSSDGHSSSYGHRQKGAGPPIVIVPAAATAPINMLNAKAFLQDGVYKLPQQCLDEGVAKKSFDIFERTIGRDKSVIYHVTSKAPDPKSHDWRRVVAVFVSGQAWQFKEWPHEGCAEGNLAAALSKILGVFVGLKGEITPENVKKWNVLRVEVPKDTRHKDRPIVQDIYAALDKFLGARQAHDKVKLKY